MKKFLDEGFLLTTQTAIDLFKNTAQGMPIFDYHCHLNPQEIAENTKFKNMTQLWLKGDHYKWRVMRAKGIDEYYITGDATDYEKFLKWSEALEMCIGNPLYVWSHLELKRYFDIHEQLNPQTSKSIWDRCNARLRKDEYSARGFIKRSNVELIGTTDSPLSDLRYHTMIAEDAEFTVKVVPSFRADDLITVQNESWAGYIADLSNVTGIDITESNSLLAAIQSRIDFFDEKGCISSDQSLEPVSYAEYTSSEIDAIVAKSITGGGISDSERSKYQTWIMQNLSRMYHEKKWVMQLRFGLLRKTNYKKTAEIGVNTGFESINDERIAVDLRELLNSINNKDMLPKTILYSLNVKDYDVLSTMAAAFQEGSLPSKIQFGSAWWYNDQKTGIIKQLTSLSDMGLISYFIGMMTDSRSYLSYTRHEYFRRILCNMIGSWVDGGEYPNDSALLEKIVKNICFDNADAYFRKTQ